MKNRGRKGGKLMSDQFKTGSGFDTEQVLWKGIRNSAAESFYSSKTLPSQYRF